MGNEGEPIEMEEEVVDEREQAFFATIDRMCEGLPLQITIATAKREWQVE